MIPRSDLVAEAMTKLTMQMTWGLEVPEINALSMAMVRKKQSIKARMRVEYKPGESAYLVHDLSDNEVYYVTEEELPEWARESMSLLHLLPPESELDDVGFFYAPGIYYLEIKTAVPSEHRRKLSAKQDGS